MNRAFFITFTILVNINLSFQAFGDEEGKVFNPTLCEKELFGQEHSNFLEPYWAQWRVGGFLAEDLLTEEEKKNKINAGICDSSIDCNNANLQMVLKHVELSPFNFFLTKEDHGSKVSSLLVSGDKCSVGYPEDSGLLFYQFQPDIPNIFNSFLKDSLEKKARIFNFSTSYYKFSKQTTLLEKIDKNLIENLFFTWSAGNASKEIEEKYRYNHQNVHVISALDPLLKITDFSNRGSVISFSAPGESYLKSYDGKDFWGTSAASPIVAGAALNIFKVNPEFTPTDIDSILRLTAFDLGKPGHDPLYGYGMPNIPKAIRFAQILKQKDIKHPSKIEENRLLQLINEITIPPNSTMESILSSSTNCEQYTKGAKELFLRYFLSGDSTEVCNLYKKHDILLSQILYCKEKESIIPKLLSIIEEYLDRPNLEYLANKGKMALQALNDSGYQIEEYVKKLYLNEQTRDKALNLIGKVKSENIFDFFFKIVSENPLLLDDSMYQNAVLDFSDSRFNDLLLRLAKRQVHNKSNIEDSLYVLSRIEKPNEEVISYFNELFEQWKIKIENTNYPFLHVMYAINSWEDRRFIGPLTSLLGNKSIDVQIEAARTIANFSDKNGLKKLLNIALDTRLDKETRIKAASELLDSGPFLFDSDIKSSVMSSLPTLEKLFGSD